MGNRWGRLWLAVSLVLSLAGLGAVPAALDSWVELGPFSASLTGISNSSGAAFQPSTAVDEAGMPTIAWADSSSGVFEIYVKRFDGAAWVEVGPFSSTGPGISFSSGAAVDPSLALDPGGNPVVAWADNSSGGYEIYVRRFDGVTWTTFGSFSASGTGITGSLGNATRPSIAVDGLGHPFVAWVDTSSGAEEICVKQFNGTAWVEVGTGSSFGAGISNSSGIAFQPRLLLNPSGQPVIAWTDTSSGAHEIYIKRFNGTAWVEVGTGSAAGTGISVSTGAAVDASLAIDSAGNPVVAWADNGSGGYQIYVRRFDGLTWSEVGAGSATGPGISASLQNATRPSLAVDRLDRPVVAWMDTNGLSQIFVRRFDGSSWVELPGGSARDGGISGTGNAEDPSLAIDSAGNAVVSWWDDDSGSQEIYVRGLSPMTPTSLKQFQSDGTTFLPAAGTVDSKVEIRGFVNSRIAGRSVRLQVEAKLSGTTLGGVATAESELLPQGSEAAVTLTLMAGSWHWAARTLDSQGLASDWISFGAGTTDFVLVTAAPLILQDDKGGCGLLGLEAVLMLGFVLAFRRRPPCLAREGLMKGS